jgi:cation diffusion facilitator family transporter
MRGLTIFGSSANRTFLITTGREAGERGSPLILGIAVGTIIIKIILTIFTRRLWKLTENPILLAISYDHRNDIFASTGAACGILLSNLGFPLFDPIAGMVVSVVIVLTGLQIIRETAGNLIGTQPGRELKERIRETATRVPGAETVEDLVVNRIGPYIVVNLELGVDGNITVSEGNNIAHNLERKLLEEFEALRGVWIHYHPKNH